ncbi:MAG: polysaccharide deacetylase family protein [Tissierellia bacterium]|nr:polysaccharide deacetylase family protein [Tissierellia bacterium]
MKKVGVIFLALFFLLFQISTFAYAEEVDKAMEENQEVYEEIPIEGEEVKEEANIEESNENKEEADPKLREKYELLRQENLNLRKEILRLHNKYSNGAAEKIPVFLYHHILPQEYIEKYNWTDNNSVLSVEAFKEQMDFLYENGFYTATLDELKAFLDGEITLPKKTVVLTFDDGYLSNVIYAYPIMKEYNFRATIFIHGHRADGEQVPFDPSTTQTISIYEAYKYRDVFDYGSHTYNLHYINENKEKALLASEREVIIEDLLKSKELMDTVYFAYPYGAYNEETIEYLKETGYEMAFTIEKEYVTNNSDKYRLPRFTVGPKTMTLGLFVQIAFGYH